MFEGRLKLLLWIMTLTVVAVLFQVLAGRLEIAMVIHFLSSFTITADFLSDIAVFEGILIGVAIPVSQQVVSSAMDRYKDPEIAQFFFKEDLYRSQYYLLLTNICFAIFLKVVRINDPLVLWIIFAWFIFNIIIFYRFVRLVEQYITNIDKLMLGKFKEYIEDILKK